MKMSQAKKLIETKQLYSLASPLLKPIDKSLKGFLELVKSGTMKNTWEGKLLSQAGRKVLIKAVIQAILTYAIGCFKLPMGLCNEIEVMIRKFWWGQRGEKRKVH